MDWLEALPRILQFLIGIACVALSLRCTGETAALWFIAAMLSIQAFKDVNR